MKRILVVFHFNFLRRDRGCANGVYEPIKILKKLGFAVDMFTTDNDEDFSDFDKYNTEHLIDNLYVVQVRPRNIVIRIIRKFIKIITSHKFTKTSNVTYKILNEFHKVIKNVFYDYIYVHYITWTDLLRNTKLPEKTVLVYNMHDNGFMQYFFNNGLKNLSKIIDIEFNALNYYQFCICNSHDEMMFYSKFYPQIIFSYFPPIKSDIVLLESKKDIDVLYIAAYNTFNVQGAIWFLDKVVPSLDQNISVFFCGKFIDGLSDKHLNKIHDRNIVDLGYVENIDALYSRTKIVIVPILGGSGIKIKTIEAMSYSIPVVSTLLGVDGLPDKYESGCLVSDKPDIFAENITKLLNNPAFYLETTNRIKYYCDKHLSYKKNEEALRAIFK
jgi:glycosyltransferase involved in cell wall biosynthesis